MKLAIFGLGSIGMRHLNNLIEFGQHDDLMVYDLDRDRYKLVDDRPFIIVALQMQDIWDWHPDAVLICTPPATHYQLVYQALLHGCHVFCEKPLATSFAQAHDLTFLNDDRNGLAVGYQMRWTMKRFRDEASGDEDAVYTCLQDMGKWPSLYKKDELLEFSHELDTAQFVKGPVEAVMAKRFGSVWNINLWHLRGYSYVRLASNIPQPCRSANSKSALWNFNQAENDQAYKDELAAFLKSCHGGNWDERLCTGAEAAHVVRIIEACRESARDCKVVHLA